MAKKYQLMKVVMGILFLAWVLTIFWAILTPKLLPWLLLFLLTVVRAVAADYLSFIKTKLVLETNTQQV